MRTTKLLRLPFLTLFALFFSTNILAQTGNVTGTISDENGFYLPGANVMIPSLSKGAISDFEGKFTLLEVPEGTYTLSVSYLGYNEKEQQIVVNADITTEVSLFVEQKSLELDGVDVVAFGLGSQAKALSTQKNNLNITNVVSTDQIGKFPDVNIGDAVKRIP
ncbi:MAG TPA: TonB-dependent receptor, partial [Pricia sp.]|nr:TonB-dependent receptor [Pricia sp.]